LALTEGDFGYNAFYRSIDTTLMGYNTYYFIRHFAQFPYPDKKIMYSHANKNSRRNPVEFVFGDVVDFTRKAEERRRKKYMACRGGQINSLLLNADLIDQMIISVHPVALGNGIKLFRDESLRNSGLTW